MLKSRKKLLLSSIAMLLVALVALGSATFAWYITNATVTAKTTQFSAASADGLLIKAPDSTVEAERNWTSKVTGLRTASSLTPAALNYGTLGDSTLWGATGQGKSVDDGTLTGALSAATVENGTVFLVDTFYVASASGTAKNATFTIKSGTNNKTYLNLAVYEGSTLKGVFTSATNVTETTKIGGTAAAPETTDSKQALTALSDNTSVGTISAAPKDGGGTKITVIGFVDGYNPLCKNTTADISSINVEYSFTAAA